MVFTDLFSARKKAWEESLGGFSRHSGGFHPAGETADGEILSFQEKDSNRVLKFKHFYGSEIDFISESWREELYLPCWNDMY